MKNKATNDPNVVSLYAFCISIQSLSPKNADEVIIQPGCWDRTGMGELEVKMPKVSMVVQARALGFCLKANSGVAKTNFTVHISIHYANIQDL